jgi:hypothetical protein
VKRCGWKTVAGEIFLCVLRIAWELQGIRRNVQNDAATIALEFHPKMQSGERMRPSAINAVTGHVAI